MLPPAIYTGESLPVCALFFLGSFLTSHSLHSFHPSLGRPFGGIPRWSGRGGPQSAEKTWGAEWLRGAAQHTKITGMTISTYLWISLIYLSNIEQNEQTSPLLQSKNRPGLDISEDPILVSFGFMNLFIAWLTYTCNTGYEFFLYKFIQADRQILVWSQVTAPHLVWPRTKIMRAPNLPVQNSKLPTMLPGPDKTSDGFFKHRFGDIQILYIYNHRPIWDEHLGRRIPSDYPY